MIKKLALFVIVCLFIVISRTNLEARCGCVAKVSGGCNNCQINCAFTGANPGDGEIAMCTYCSPTVGAPLTQLDGANIYYETYNSSHICWLNASSAKCGNPIGGGGSGGGYTCGQKGCNDGSGCESGTTCMANWCRLNYCTDANQDCVCDVADVPCSYCGQTGCTVNGGGYYCVGGTCSISPSTVTCCTPSCPGQCGSCVAGSSTSYTGCAVARVGTCSDGCSGTCAASGTCNYQTCTEKYPNPAVCTTCPGGQSTAISGPLCRQSLATCGTTCGGATNCPSSNYCYLPETNTAPAAPTYTYICYGGTVEDGKCYRLSTNSASPTIVRAPQAGERIYAKVSVVAAPGGGRGVSYSLAVNNVSPTASSLFTSTRTPENYTTNLYALSAWSATQVYSVTGTASSLNLCTNGVYMTSGNAPLGYFRIDSVPTVVSVTPNVGISGTNTDADNGTMCTDNNPVSFTVTYRDADGNGDIRFAGFWADNTTPLTEANSGHGAISKGTWIRINASGSCIAGCPDMQVTAAGTVIGIYSIAPASADYYYYSPTPVSFNDIIITNVNASGGRNIALNGMYMGVSKEGGNFVSFVTTLTAASPTKTFVNSAVDIGSGTYQSFGLSASDWILDVDGVAVGAGFQYCADSTNRGDALYTAACTATTANAVTNVTYPSSTDISVTYNVGFFSNIGQNLNLYGNVIDSTAFDIPTGPSRWVDIGDRTLDLQHPTSTVSSFNLIDQNTSTVNWQIVDAVGLLNTYGHIALTGSEYSTTNQRSIFDTTQGAPGVNMRVPVAGDYVTSPESWNLTAPSIPSLGANTWGRLETYNVADIDSGTMSIRIGAVDTACNFWEDLGANSLTIDEPWFVTKGGFVYSDDNIIDPVVQDTTTPAFSIPSSSPWTVPYQVLNNEANVSTELLLVNGGTTSALTWVGASAIYNPYTVTGYTYPNLYTQGTSSYLWLKQNVNSITMYDIERQDVSGAGANLTGAISNTCVNIGMDKCAIFSTQNITVSNITCDKQTLVMSDGNITLQPPIRVDGSGSHGCIFVAGGDIVIGAGTHVSDDINKISKSEYINGYLVAGNQITILDVDSSLPVTDILEVRGGMVAFGEGGSSQSVMWNRSLRLKQNMLYPTFGIHYDPRYLGISANFFDNSSAYVKDEGYKAY